MAASAHSSLDPLPPALPPLVDVTNVVLSHPSTSPVASKDPKLENTTYTPLLNENDAPPRAPPQTASLFSSPSKISGPCGLTLPSISDLFDVADVALENRAEVLPIQPELVHTNPGQPLTPMWSPNEATPPLPLPSPRSLLALTAPEPTRDLRCNRTIPLPPVSPTPHLYQYNSSQQPAYENKDFHFNPPAFSPDFQSLLPSYPSPHFNFGEPYAHHREYPHAEQLISPNLMYEPFVPPPHFQSSSSSLHNALGLSFHPTPDPLCISPIETSSAKHKSRQDKSARPTVKCHLCPKSYTSTGMSRHLAWHRRQGDIARRLALGSVQQSAIFLTDPTVAPSLLSPNGSKPASETGFAFPDWNLESSSQIYVPKPTPFSLHPHWSRSFSDSHSPPSPPVLSPTHMHILNSSQTYPSSEHAADDVDLKPYSHDGECGSQASAPSEPLDELDSLINLPP